MAQIDLSMIKTIPFREEWEMGPIGFDTDVHNSSVMVVAKGRDGVLYYVSEVPVSVSVNEVPITSKESDAKRYRHQWLFSKEKLDIVVFGKEARLQIGENVKIEKGWTLVLAKWPYSYGVKILQEGNAIDPDCVVITTKLRTPYQKGLASEEHINLERKLCKCDIAASLKLLSEKSYDYWQNDSRKLSSFLFGLWGESVRASTGKTQGLCEDFVGYCDELYKAPQCCDWLQKIENRKFDIRSILHIKRMMDPIKILDETIFNADSLLKLSIRQALAGPAKAQNLEGKPVVQYLESVFKWNLNSFNRTAPDTTEYLDSSLSQEDEYPET
jgi:hypothetical protein